MLDTKLLKLHDDIVQDSDPLTLNLDDSEYIQVIDQSIKDSQNYFENKNLYTRQQKNLSYYLGKEIDTLQVASYSHPYLENIIYEGVRRILPIVMSRLPDLTVRPSSLDVQSVQNARILTDVFNTDTNRRDMRRLFGIAHVHEQLFFYAVIKAVWDTSIGLDGNYKFLNVYPTNIVWDHTCPTNNADDMRFVAENSEVMIKDLLMMFPKRAAEFLKYLGIEKDTENREQRLASPIKIWEVWFHWFKEVTVDGETQWEKLNGVVWKYKDFVFGKMRNPWFDYEGRTHLFTKEVKEKGLPSEADLFQLIFGQENTQTDTVYYNYFKNPRKPYYFMVYESLGEDAIDATNRIEQVLYFQDHINMTGVQINQMNEQSSGKAIANSDAIDKETIKKIDWHNTKEMISVNGDDVDRALKVFQMPPAPPQLYQSKSENRSIGFEMLGVGNTTRGVNQGDQTLGEAQMFRESDYGFLDDLTENTLNEAAEWIAEWKMQFIRVFYTKAHLVDAAGKDGENLYLSLTQDIVEDGMSVAVSASGVDKMMRKTLAVKNQEMGVGDILSYYEDTQQSNPKERARRAFLLKTAPMQYYQEYLADDKQTGPVPGPIQPPLRKLLTKLNPLLPLKRHHKWLLPQHQWYNPRYD